MTVAEIVDETVEYYMTHPRAIRDDGGCYYFDSDTRCMCAVGRCLMNPELTEGNNALAADLPGDLGCRNLDDLLKPPYRGQTEKFWEDLQELHDEGAHWVPNEQGGNDLSAPGIGVAVAIVRDHTTEETDQ